MTALMKKKNTIWVTSRVLRHNKREGGDKRDRKEKTQDSTIDLLSGDMLQQNHVKLSTVVFHYNRKNIYI